VREEDGFLEAKASTKGGDLFFLDVSIHFSHKDDRWLPSTCQVEIAMPRSQRKAVLGGQGSW